MKRTSQIMTHSYGGYTRGCRCQICSEAKNAYVRERRAAGRRLAAQHTAGRNGEVGSTRYVADVRKHGTNYAYYERGCRCQACTSYSTALNASLPSRRRISSPGRTAVTASATG